MKRIGLQLMILCLLPILVTGSFLFMINSPVLLIAGMVAILAIVAWLILYFEWQTQFMMLFVFLLPFSVEYPVAGDHMMLLPSEPLLVMAAIMLGIELFRKPFPIPKFFLREILWIVPLAAAFILSIPFSTMGLVSLKFSSVNLLYIIVFFGYVGVLSTRNPGLPWRLLMIYSASFSLVAVWSVYQYSLLEWNPIVVRGIFSPFYKDHTIFGATAALLAMAWFARGIAVQNIRHRVFALIVAHLHFCLVILSGSRAAFISLFFSLFVILLMRYRVKI
ncbi:MAG: hypothetical protein IH591_00545, partial [Bacteroidales bacterium]|nr:hypothetical protein [Bacteroidales bacterium]